MSTAPIKPGRTYHPLVNIAEWRKGCSCAPKDFPVQCEECTEGLILAVERWFQQYRSAYPFDISGILENLDERAKEYDKPVVASEAAKIIRTFEADLYAAQDQVAGLQELMAEQDARLADRVALLARCKDWIEAASHGVLSPVAQDFQGVVGQNAEGLGQQSVRLLDELNEVAWLASQSAPRGPQPMDSAPTDGTRILIHTEVHHYSADRYQICAWRMIGSQWLEARFLEGKWVEWCGNEKTKSTNVLHPIEWAPLPSGAGQ